MIFTVHLCVRGGFFVQVCTLCKYKPADTLLFFVSKCECTLSALPGDSKVTALSVWSILTLCVFLCVGVQQRHTHVCLSLCDWLHWDFVQTELRFSLALLSVCVNAHVSLYVSGYSVCASVFLWRSLNVCVVWMHGCPIQTILFALPVPALDGGSSVSLACLM